MALTSLLIIPLVSAALSALVPRGKERLLEYGAVFSSIMQLILALSIGAGVLQGEAESALYAFRADALAAFGILFVSIVATAAAIHSVGHLRAETANGLIGFRRVRQYFVLFHLFSFTMLAATVSASPILMWAAVEGTTLASAFLITFYNKPSALEAGWKFLILNSVGLLLGFLGALLFLSAAAAAGMQATFITWDNLRSVAMNLDPAVIKVAFVFILVGFGTKVGFVPMHTWLPDAHSNAPIPISGLLSGVLLNIALIGILRFRSITDTIIDPAFSEVLLLGFGSISVLVAGFIMYAQKNYKRLLAYSSIEHMGLITIGFALGGAATFAALFHMFYHSLMKPVLFFAAGNFFLRYGTTKISGIMGALTVVPVSAAVFLLGLFAMAGVPPSGIFFTKIGILSAALADAPIVAGATLAAILIVFAAFLKHGSAMLFSGTPKQIQRGENNYWTLASIAFLLSIFVLTSIHMPQMLVDLIEAAAGMIQHPIL